MIVTSPVRAIMPLCALGIALTGCSADTALPGIETDLSTRSQDGLSLACPVCAELAPAGWEGPVAMSEGTPGAPPSCPSGFARPVFVGSAGLRVPSAECKCSCGPAVGVTCFYTQVRVITSNNACTCSPNGCFAVPLRDYLPNTCLTNVFMEPPGPVLSVAFDGAIDGLKGRCEASEPAAPPPVSWERTASLCASDQAGGGDCQTGQICLSSNEDMPPSKLCIFRPGDVLCPTGSYAKKSLYFEGLTDDRSCSPCECGVPTGRSCSVTVTGFESAQCAPPVMQVTVKSPGPSPGCFMGVNAKYFKASPATILDGGTCAASGGKLTGSASAKGPTTICCAG